MKFEVKLNEEKQADWKVKDVFLVDKKASTVRMIVKHYVTENIGTLCLNNGFIYYLEEGIKDVNELIKRFYPNAIRVVQEEPVQFKKE